MIYDFNDPASIAQWIAVRPEAHVRQLRSMYRLWPEFRDAIEAGVKLSKEIERDPHPTHSRAAAG